MVDGIRVGIRIATVAALILASVAVYALFNSVKIPSANISTIVQAVGVGKAFLMHWAPEAVWMFTAVLALYVVRWTVFLARYAVLGLKWLLVAWR